DRSRKVYFEILVVVVLHYVVLVELSEAIVDELVTIRFLEMLKDELGKAREECTRFFLLVYFLQELFASEREALVKLLRKGIGKFLTEIVDQEFFPDVGTRPFVGENPTEVSYVVNNVFAIIQT